MKILFLDFDGVISTNRAWIANKHIEDFYDRWIDPIATNMLADLCETYDYTVVVTSTWRNFGEEHCRRAMGPIEKYLHKDWRTREIWPKGPMSSVGSRPAEIDDWLRRNTNMTTDYLVVDDDSFAWTEDQRERWIKTDQLNGFSTQNYEEVINRNEV